MARRTAPRRTREKDRRPASTRKGAAAAGGDTPVPRSGLRGIRWPALPTHADALVLALQHQFEQSQWWPAETMGRHQLRQLELLLAHAARTVPFYRDRLKVLAGTRRGDLTMETFRRLPVLSRSDIQEAGAALVSRHPPRDHGKVSEISTSGSTGRPITVKTTGITRLFFQALNLRYHLWHGRDFSGTTARITILPPSPAAGTPTNWVPGYASGPMIRFDVSRPADEQIAWLKQVNPDYLLTYPSNLLALVQRCEETGDGIAGLREVATMGEVLDPEVRAACERVWGLRVVDAYSAQELGMIALQCPEHPHYHVQSENVLVEVLGEDGRPCRPGEVGRLVVTDLHNFAMPLIRYENGDYAEVGGPCPCGRGLDVITRILGRTRNMLTRPDGKRMWPVFSRALREALPPLRQAQLVQRRRDEIEVRLVLSRPLTAGEERRGREALREALGDAFTYRFVYVDEIARPAGGKFEEVRSELED